MDRRFKEREITIPGPGAYSIKNVIQTTLIKLNWLSSPIDFQVPRGKWL